MWILLAPDFNATNNFTRILNFNYSFVDVNVDVSYYYTHKFFGVTNNSKPNINGSIEENILISMFLISSLFRLLIKNPAVRIKIIS